MSSQDMFPDEITDSKLAYELSKNNLRHKDVDMIGKGCVYRLHGGHYYCARHYQVGKAQRESEIKAGIIVEPVEGQCKYFFTNETSCDGVAQYCRAKCIYNKFRGKYYDHCYRHYNP